MPFNFLYILLKVFIKPKTLPQFSHFYYLCAEYSEMADAECPQVGDPEFFLSPLKVVFTQEGVINSWARLSDVLGHRTSQQSKACDEQNFRKWRCYCFSCEHLSLFFPVNEAAMWFFFWSRIPLPYIPTEEVSVFWLLRENSAKKGFWSVLVSLQVRKIMWVRGATFRSTKTRFSLDKKHEKTCSFAPK